MKKISLLLSLLFSVVHIYSQVDYEFPEFNTETALFSGSDPVWEGDGSILFTNKDSEARNRLYRYDFASKILTDLGVDNLPVNRPVKVPGKNQVVADAVYNEVHKLVVIDLGKVSKPQPLMNRNIQMKQADFNPTGMLVAFIGKSETDKYWNLYTYDFKYDNLNKLSDDQADIDYPKWSPDGSLISYGHKNSMNGRWVVSVIHWYGKHDFTLEDASADLLHGNWSHNGYKLVYVMKDQHGSKLMSCKKDGHDRTILTRSSEVIATPDWSPDGISIIFTISNSQDASTIMVLHLE